MKMSVECGTRAADVDPVHVDGEEADQRRRARPRQWIGVYMTVLLRCWPCTAA